VRRALNKIVVTFNTLSQWKGYGGGETNTILNFAHTEEGGFCYFM